jgi:hypothetical protein
MIEPVHSIKSFMFVCSSRNKNTAIFTCVSVRTHQVSLFFSFFSSLSLSLSIYIYIYIYKERGRGLVLFVHQDITIVIFPLVLLCDRFLNVFVDT